MSEGMTFHTVGWGIKNDSKELNIFLLGLLYLVTTKTNALVVWQLVPLRENEIMFLGE
jgi:hypothetical protein